MTKQGDYILEQERLRIVYSSLEQTKDWCLNSWANFRSLNDYWILKHKVKGGLLSPSRMNFNRLRLGWMIDYNRNIRKKI